MSDSEAPAEVAERREQATGSDVPSVERLARALTADAGEGLTSEIAAARLALARLLREEEDPHRLADGVAKAVSVVLKARQMERQLDAAGDSLTGMATRILEEMGMGSDEQ